MALDGTYDGLKASLGDWLNRTDISGAIPDFIALAEGELTRRLVVEGAPNQMIGRAATAINDEFVLVPPDFLGAVTFLIDGSTTPLEYVTPEKITERKALYSTQTGKPEVYSVVGNEFQFWPAPTDASLQGEVTYIRRIPALSATRQANWLLTLYPDAYLFGALIQSAPYLKDDDRLPAWQAKFDTVVSGISIAGRRAQTAAHLAMSINPSVV